MWACSRVHSPGLCDSPAAVVAHSDLKSWPHRSAGVLHFFHLRTPSLTQLTLMEKEIRVVSLPWILPVLLIIKFFCDSSVLTPVSIPTLTSFVQLIAHTQTKTLACSSYSQAFLLWFMFPACLYQSNVLRWRFPLTVKARLSTLNLWFFATLACSFQNGFCFVFLLAFTNVFSLPPGGEYLLLCCLCFGIN